MRLLTWLGRKRYPYEPLISVSISKGRLLSNLNEFRQFAKGCRIAPVLKSNAYGHGLFEVADILEQADRKSKQGEGIPFFVVDSYFEAVALRAHHVRTPLLVIGYTRPETITKSHLKATSYMITSLDTLQELKSVGHPLSIQLKFDTGMHRQGLLPEEIDAAIEIIQKNPYLYLEGICTHFADADNTDSTFTRGQISVWDDIVKRFKMDFTEIKYIHAANTDGSRFSDQLKNNVMRLGIGLYGLSENARLNETLKLQPVLEMKTIITGIKKLAAGQSAGYGATFTAMYDMTIATVPVGYFEGVDRRLSSDPDGSVRGFIQVGPNRIACPIIGRVSMNITILDVSAVPDAKIGTEAVVMSSETKDPNSLASMAKACGMIDYELAVHIPEHLKRVVTE
ncbi:MAG: Alanine racemase [Candidatus Parcubacteria bacterium]|nr:Alanine racemase [Candidatus Parcubacteria bacterium]